ncbi:MAG: SDR family NAD(P)-dependent oxidoreductase [Chloroflexi bacterium]|nr:SDR family NAD(P)-dependent oxidoreductase [Chloroflexota bacterium]
MKNLRGRTAILTGASKGIGVHVARALAKQGINLVLAARSVNALEEVRKAVERQGVRAIAVPTDVGDRSALKSLVERAVSEFGSIDILVNNAGIELILAYHKLRPEEIEEMVRVNLLAPMHLTWLVLPGMLERRQGHIVNMSSLAGKAGPAYNEPYGATKAGLIGFTQSLRGTYRRSGVSASVVCPGFVEEGMYAKTKEEFGVTVPRLLGVSKPEAVASGVIRAIKKDLPEVIVNPGPIRPLLTMAAISPSLGEWMIERIGAVAVFRKVAKLRESQRVKGEQDAGGSGTAKS